MDSGTCRWWEKTKRKTNLKKYVCRSFFEIVSSMMREIWSCSTTTQHQIACWNVLGRWLSHIYKCSLFTFELITRSFHTIWSLYDSHFNPQETENICGCRPWIIPSKDHFTPIQSNPQEAETICGCRPWNIPSEDGSSMCWVVGNVCFHQVLVSSFFVINLMPRWWKRSEVRN